MEQMSSLRLTTFCIVLPVTVGTNHGLENPKIDSPGNNIIKRFFGSSWQGLELNSISRKHRIFHTKILFRDRVKTRQVLGDLIDLSCAILMSLGLSKKT